MTWRDDPLDLVDDAIDAAGAWYEPGLAQQIRTDLLEAARGDLELAVEKARYVLDSPPSWVPAQTAPQLEGRAAS